MVKSLWTLKHIHFVLIINSGLSNVEQLLKVLHYLYMGLQQSSNPIFWSQKNQTPCNHIHANQLPSQQCGNAHKQQLRWQLGNFYKHERYKAPKSKMVHIDVQDTCLRYSRDLKIHQIGRGRVHLTSSTNKTIAKAPGTNLSTKGNGKEGFVANCRIRTHKSHPQWIWIIWEIKGERSHWEQVLLLTCKSQGYHHIGSPKTLA